MQYNDAFLKIINPLQDANEYRFERQPRNFNCVLSFLTTGKLHLGEETCVIAFSQVRRTRKVFFVRVREKSIRQVVGRRAKFTHSR